MTQPEKPDSSRGTRPQLFGAPTERKSRQPDFGPSILATIDSVPRRDRRSSDALSLKRVLVMAAVALAATGVYFGLKLSAPKPSAMPHASVAQPNDVVPASALPEKPAETALSSTAPAVLTAAPEGASGAAAIETVAALPRVVAASAADSAPNVAASMSNIQQVLARSHDGDVSNAEQGPARKAPSKPKESPSARVASPTAKAVAKSGKDSDADLLAAMLPHIKRSAPLPTSPAYDKRCGPLGGDAASDCRAKFCAGREGVDAACPATGGR